jgi:hypothetical protein
MERANGEKTKKRSSPDELFSRHSQKDAGNENK